MSEDSILTIIGRIMVFAMPTIITYCGICYSPNLSGKLVGTAVQDFITNIIVGLLFSIRQLEYDNLFIAFIILLLLIMQFIKVHTSHVFLLQLAEKPVQKDFQDSIRKSLGAPPVVKFVSYKTLSAPQSQQNSREMSPVEYQYGTWQDLTPLPEIKYSESLRVTTATNCCFTEKAKKEIAEKQKELLKKAGPHRGIITSIACNDCTDYFVSNTSGKKTDLLKMLSSKPSIVIYCISSLLGYRLWFEYLYYRASKEVKVHLYKCVGVSSDNLRAKRGEIDREAQNNFSMYIHATDKEGTIAH